LTHKTTIPKMLLTTYKSSKSL